MDLSLRVTNFIWWPSCCWWWRGKQCEQIASIRCPVPRWPGSSNRIYLPMPGIPTNQPPLLFVVFRLSALSPKQEQHQPAVVTSQWVSATCGDPQCVLHSATSSVKSSNCKKLQSKRSQKYILDQISTLSPVLFYTVTKDYVKPLKLQINKKHHHLQNWASSKCVIIRMSTGGWWRQYVRWRY